MPIQIMKNVGLNSENIVNNVGMFNDIYTTNNSYKEQCILRNFLR